MRVGLLPRWMGVLGIFSGVLIFLPIGGARWRSSRLLAGGDGHPVRRALAERRPAGVGGRRGAAVADARPSSAPRAQAARQGQARRSPAPRRSGARAPRAAAAAGSSRKRRRKRGAAGVADARRPPIESSARALTRAERPVSRHGPATSRLETQTSSTASSRRCSRSSASSRPREFREHALLNDPAVYEQAARDPQAWWAEQAERARTGSSRGSTVLDDSNPPFYKWFVGGTLNASYNCLDRHVRGRARRARRLPLARRGGRGARHHLRRAARRGQALRQRAQGPRRAARATSSGSTCR